LQGGLKFIKLNLQLIFEGVNSNKIRKANDPKKKNDIRTSNYDELKELWENLKERVKNIKNNRNHLITVK
jgi:type III restriction enzyme